MKRAYLIVALVAALAIVFCSAHRAVAQDATPIPYPSADPHTYDDPAMHFQTPAKYYLVMRRLISVDDLGDPQTVAEWVGNPGTDDMRTLTITVEQYDQGLVQYETNFENEVRTNIDDAIVSNRTPFTMSNGMPAYFLSITSGSGFDGKKVFDVIWADGTRGVSISLTGRLGSLEEKEARATLADVTAVRYPAGRL